MTVSKLPPSFVKRSSSGYSSMISQSLSESRQSSSVYSGSQSSTIDGTFHACNYLYVTVLF